MSGAKQIGYIHASEIEVRVYEQEDGVKSAEFYYDGVIQNRLGKNMLKLLLQSLEAYDN
jgi:hypothetical protein